jgi:hypothetical protein
MNLDAALLTNFAANQTRSSTASAMSIGLGGSNGDVNNIYAAMQDRGDGNGGEGHDDSK